MANEQNEVVLTSRIQSRNDTAALWNTKNPILLKGEIGIENDTRKIKIGDGITQWNELQYVSAHEVVLKSTDPQANDIGHENGTIWINQANNKIYILVAQTTTAVWLRLTTSAELAVVAESQVAQKLKTARTISVSGAGTGSVNFDGSANADLAIVLKNSGVTAGSYTKLTVDAKGIVTNATNIIASDIPNLTLSKISDAGTAASKTVGTLVGNVVEVLEGGKIDENLLPAIAITEIYEVANQAAMLAINCQRGDVAVRSDENKSYILKQSPASTLTNWVLLRTPTDLVLSVNGKTGAVILTTTNVAEGSGLYFTEERATTNFNANYIKKSTAELADGATVLHSTDTLIFDGGNA